MNKLLATAAIVSVALTGCASTEPTPPDFSKQTNATYTWDDSKSEALNYADMAIPNNGLKDAELKEDSQEIISGLKSNSMAGFSLLTGGLVEAAGMASLYYSLDNMKDWKPTYILLVDTKPSFSMGEIHKLVSEHFESVFSKTDGFQFEGVSFYKRKKPSNNNAVALYSGEACSFVTDGSDADYRFYYPNVAHTGCYLGLNIKVAGDIKDKNGERKTVVTIEQGNTLDRVFDLASNSQHPVLFPARFEFLTGGGVETGFPFVFKGDEALLFTTEPQSIPQSRFSI